MESPVLLYHKIDRPSADVKIRGAYTTPRRFQRQMSYLKRSGYHFVTASKLVERYVNEGKFPERTVCVTFDDGWKDNYLNAYPILKELRIPATIFIVAGCVGKTSAQVTAEGEGPREHMSADDLREMSKGGIEFGSHSMNHQLMDRIDESEIDHEVTGSKSLLEELLQTECPVFAYPAGFHTAYARDAVKRAGYLGGFTTVYGSNDSPDAFAINRTEILRRHGLPFRFPRRIKSIFQR
ncbi:MAG TPA: polysaccharide deacetylase family protein [Pyrinomonadaceae bacterium]|nr:polysaccharide deacetylase family protein [Pyrinomonadaceae bacterium]